MDTFLLQDWITISDASAGTITQAASEWLDLEQYQDVVAWLEAPQGGGSVTFSLQTAPARDERLFTQVAKQQGSGSTKVFVIQVGDSPFVAVGPVNVPAQMARWLRWSVAGSGTNWSTTFRITVMANRQGR
jgi:hypothetical protein